MFQKEMFFEEGLLCSFNILVRSSWFNLHYIQQVFSTNIYVIPLATLSIRIMIVSLLIVYYVSRWTYSSNVHNAYYACLWDIWDNIFVKRLDIEHSNLPLLRRFPPGVCLLKSLTHLHLNDVQLEDLPVDIGGCVDSSSFQLYQLRISWHLMRTDLEIRHRLVCDYSD